jgi:hypothetical protein
MDSFSDSFFEYHNDPLKSMWSLVRIENANPSRVSIIENRKPPNGKCADLKIR